MSQRRVSESKGLKQFMSEYGGNQTVETRVMLVFSFSVLVQLMYFNESEETSVTYGSLVFALRELLSVLQCCSVFVCTVCGRSLCYGDSVECMDGLLSL